MKTSGTDGGTWFGRTALAAGVAIAVAGCAAPRYTGYGPPLPPDQYKNAGGPNPADPYVFDITADPQDPKGCPFAVSVDPKWRKCPDQEEDCVRVKGGQSVQFQSQANDFVLQFDPFGQTTIDAGGKPVVLPTQKNPKVAKPYTFTIRGTKPGCESKVVDPQIILD